MDPVTISKPKCFRIPTLAWCVWGLWAAFNVWAAIQAGINSTVLGMITGQLILPLLLPFIITWPLWFIFRRSQKMASILFSILLILIILSQFQTLTHVQHSATATTSAANTTH
jgi:hypothetical protein